MGKRKEINKTNMSFELAKMTYVHRYTCEHVPQWAGKPCEGNGLYYAPQHATDQEWYDSLDFEFNEAHSREQSWPHGRWLMEAGRRGRFVTATPAHVKKLLEGRAADMAKLAAQFDLEFRCMIG